MNCLFSLSDIIQLVVLVATIAIAICSARSTAKHANEQITEIQNLAQQQLLESRMYLASAMYANQKLILEMKDNLRVKKEDHESNIVCLTERKDVMKMNIERLEKLIEKSELLQSQYENFEQNIEKFNNRK